LTSRPRFARLPEIRGVLDIEALEAYLVWAARPEAVGFERTGPRQAAIHADLGPEDLILVRISAEGWIAEQRRDSGDWTPIPIQSDPLGFLVLDPGGAGATEIRLLRQARIFPPPLAAAPLLAGEFPLITAEGVVDALSFEPPPFQAGDHVTIFGERFSPGQTVVSLDERVLDVSYASNTQINFQLPPDLRPGVYPLRAIAADRSSLAVDIEVSE
jgi:hypothetical protein